VLAALWHVNCREPSQGLEEDALRGLTAPANRREGSEIVMGSLYNVTVVVTGVSSGMGFATALAFARRGANLVLAARHQAPLECAARECEALGGRALAIPTDVADADGMRELAHGAAATFGRIDLWINNAGMSLWGPFESIPLESQAASSR
jgi:NAD(P)-dependent dehydrogenase (short-subunit alcohol dehydrogenase family)